MRLSCLEPSCVHETLSNRDESQLVWMVEKAWVSDDTIEQLSQYQQHLSLDYLIFKKNNLLLI